VQQTQGEVAREAVESRGLLYFGDVLADVKDRLRRMEPKARTALAAACASRLMASHVSLPTAEQRSLTLLWNDTLAVIWEALFAEHSHSAIARVRQSLETFRASPFTGGDSQGIPDDADEDAVAAAIHSAESLCDSDPAAAFWAASRLVDWAFSQAEAEIEPPGSGYSGVEHFIEESAHPAVQRELERLLSGLSLLETRGTDAAVLERLHTSFVAG
jgi:hypothetical protein